MGNPAQGWERLNPEWDLQGPLDGPHVIFNDSLKAGVFPRIADYVRDTRMAQLLGIKDPISILILTGSAHQSRMCILACDCFKVCCWCI